MVNISMFKRGNNNGRDLGINEIVYNITYHKEDKNNG